MRSSRSCANSARSRCRTNQPAASQTVAERIAAPRLPAGGSQRRLGTPLLAPSARGTPRATGKLEIIRKGSDTDALRAIEQTESRIYGKPKETVETQSTEIPEQLAEIRAMPFEQKLALLRQLGPIAVPDRRQAPPRRS